MSVSRNSTCLSNLTTSLPRHVTRRDFLRVTGASAGAVVLGFPAIIGAATRPLAFLHGVASGDPLPNGAIIWTRVTPEPAATPGSGQGRAVTVTWEVATDSAFRKIVAGGDTKTGPTQDFT